jgi:hypothetical protein
MEHNESQREAALGILTEAGVLSCCAIHEDTVIEGSGDVEVAYELGKEKFAAGAFADLFSTSDEMTDCIKEVFEDNSEGECGQCSRD